MKIVFWDGDYGSIGTTTAMISMAYCVSEACRKKTVVLSMQFSANAMEKYITGKRKIRESVFEEMGIEQIRRLVKAGIADRDSADSYCYSCSDFLDFLPGYVACKGHNPVYEYESVVIKMFEYLEKKYDFVFCDASHTEKGIRQRLFEAADMLVICFPQNIFSLKFFRKELLPAQLPVFYLFTQYDRNSKQNLNNLRTLRKELKKNNSSFLPYCTEIKDGCADGALIQTIQKGCFEKASDSLRFFYQTLCEASECFLNYSQKSEVIHSFAIS